MSELEKVLQTALNEVGYLEKKTNSQLEDKTANAGYNNYTKYARDLDSISNFYNGKKNGYAWCDMFVDWCFVKALGIDRAKELLNQPNSSYGAGCQGSSNYFKQINQFFDKPQIGDQIFFKDSSGKMYHTGLVYDVDDIYVYTIEGNTSSKSGVVENGGSVEKKKYSLNYSKIAGYGRPKYTIESEEDIMLDELIKLYGKDKVKKALEVLIKSVNDDGKVADWAKEEFEKAVANKITDGSNPEMFATRQEVAIMVNRVIEK